MTEPTPAGTVGLLTVAQVCRRIPGTRGTSRVNPSTVTRWIVRGCPARNGRRVRLAAVRAGCRWMITSSALDSFFAELADTAPGPTSPPPDGGSRADARRQAASTRAAEELERRGA